MCGICGKISNRGVAPELIKGMADAIAHRGPDDDGYYHDETAGLGHRRLSIIDLEGGRQPLSNEDDTLWIVFNGEIYNFLELRKDLEQKGHRFKTNTDTEVIVHLYEDLKEDCLSKLNGMFAFALWDKKEKKLFMARDRIGQKPLFYSQNGDSFSFGSEVKSLLADADLPRDIDFEAVHHYLSLRFIPAPLTMFRSIRKLPAGHYLTYQRGRIDVKKYWSLNFKNKLQLQESEYLERLEDQLKASVNSHLVSDVPVGAFLSGGMDTSMVVAMMGKTSNVNFQTFAIGVKEQDYNELPYARMVSEHCNTRHTERIINADIIRMMPTMVWYMDEPSDPIAACMFHAAKLASENVKVVMGGDGGDELFAGFDRYLGMSLVDYYNLIPAIVRTKTVITDSESDTRQFYL